MSQEAFYVLKLRQNIALEGDLFLAEMELGTFIPGKLNDVTDVQGLLAEIPQFATFDGLCALSSHVRKNGKQAYTATAPLELLPKLIQRMTFVQQLYCVTEDTPFAQGVVAEVRSKLGRVITAKPDCGKILIYAVPHYALFELSDVVAKHTNNVLDTSPNLSSMLDALMGNTNDKHSASLANGALSAKQTTSHLSHDIHYYKAKFFPRLARSLLNVCMQRVGDNRHRVIDNFAGSGTALLEASSMGIPSVGLDLDPLSVLIARAKLQAVTLSSSLLAEQTAIAIDRLSARLDTTNLQPRLLDAGQPEIINNAIMFPAWLMKNRRMTLEIAAKLSDEIIAVRQVVNSCDPAVRDIFRVLMSDAISRRIRMRFLGTGVGRFSLTYSRSPLSKMFIKSLQEYVKVAATCEWLHHTIGLEFADAQVVLGDARKTPDCIGQFDVLVTSPPYLPASSGRESYAKARALSLIALGMRNHEDIDDLVDDSIGSMDAAEIDVNELTQAERDIVEWLRRDELRAIKAEPTARYFIDMRQAFSEMYRFLRPGAIAVVISGKQSTFYQFSTRESLYVVPVAEMLADEAKHVGFDIVGLYDLQLNKGSKNARPRSLDEYYETIIMLRRPEQYIA